jgi:hypothetical protein
VLRAVDALEYRPHLYARHMRTQRSKVFAFISDDIATTPFAGQIIQGAQVAAWRHEMLLLMFNIGGDKVVEEAGVESALERGVEGIILATMRRASAQERPSCPARTGRLLRQKRKRLQRGTGSSERPICGYEAATREGPSAYCHDQRRPKVPCCGWAA